MRLPFSTSFKVVQDLVFRIAEIAFFLDHLTDSKENGQAFKEAEAIFIHADSCLEMEDKLLVKGVVFTNACIK